MEHQLSNHYIKATIDSRGAELKSLQTSSSSLEYIWKGDPDIWARHAPILFPIVGKLVDDQYTMDNTTYHLGQHGFARDMEFRLVEQQPDSLVLEVTETTETLERYPSKFCLRVIYTLWKNSIFTKFIVKNTDSGEMYFSIGGHPGFTCPIDDDHERSDYYLEFQQSESAESHILSSGLISGKTKKVIHDRRIIISDDLFDEDALIFKELASDKVSLKHQSGKDILHFHFPDFPYLGIWSKSSSSPYVCIEPWFGLADNHNHNGMLSEKEGIQSLVPGATFHCEYGIEIC